MAIIKFSLPVALVLVQALFANSVMADLRAATTPKKNFVVESKDGAVKFATTEVKYNEPATFGYKGLENQKANNYDNFLRSNVDNEQDNRNFNTEAGKDMLPFRTLEAATTGAAVTVAPGVQQTVPLRWNNPHASEIEVNIWVKGNTVVVPVKKPVCSGEGHQDGVVTYTIPADFNTKVSATVPGFAGCTKVGDCNIQFYAHSVEPRTYAFANPIIISGYDANAPKAPDASGIAPAGKDSGTIDTQPNALCLPMNDPSSNIASAAPRYARLVSDEFNHSYQSSDYSPYSGQQPEAISKNLQAASILKMTSGNRGELGKAALDASTKDYIKTLDAKVNSVIKKYEQAANNIIKNTLKDTKTTGTAGNQQLANGFRVLEAGATNAARQTTTTYIPSFIVPADKVAAAKATLSGSLSTLIDGTNTAGIYVAALNELKADFAKAAQRGVKYQPAMIKSTVTTMSDATQFKKVDANGKQDGGKYAATLAFQKAGVKFLAALANGEDAISADTLPAAEGETLAANPDDEVLPESGAETTPQSESGASSIALSASGAAAIVAAVAFLQL